jgi:integrase/recombinase XerD
MPIPEGRMPTRCASALVFSAAVLANQVSLTQRLLCSARPAHRAGTLSNIQCFGEAQPHRVFLENNNMTINQAYPQFLNYARAERGYSVETIRNLSDAFRNWILPTLGDIDVDRLELNQVLRLRTLMVDKSLSVSRRYGITMWVKLFLRFCHTHLAQSCLDPATVSLPRRAAPKVEYLSNGEIAQLLEAIPMHLTTGKRLRALIELLLGTGLRIGEALSLPREPFERGTTQLRVVGKGGKPRTVFFPARTLDWVGVYLQSRVDTEPMLFATTGDIPRRLARADISRMFIQLRNKAGLSKRVSPHLLRHTYCTNLLNNGVDIRFIRDLAGHRDIGTTARYYLGVDEKKLRSIVDTQLKYDSPGPG